MRPRPGRHDPGPPRARGPHAPAVWLSLAARAVNAVGALGAGSAAGALAWGRSVYTLFLLAVILSMSSLIPVLKGTVATGDPFWYQLAHPAVILFGILLGGVMERRRSSAV